MFRQYAQKSKQNRFSAASAPPKKKAPQKGTSVPRCRIYACNVGEFYFLVTAQKL